MATDAGSSQLRKKHAQKKKGQTNIVRLTKFKRHSEKQKIDALERDAANFAPKDDLTLFADLPISEQTKRGLKKAFFVNMTEIQAQSLPVSLKGKDVLGAARTGSGKTLAFLIPVLEILYRQKWGPTDGLGALIISPTRELAVQIFEVLRSIGGHHTFSAGLVIGGKNLKDESDRLSRMNILVATPGRLLQHMDQTVGFDADNLQVLVLDEADRILDMGFSRTLTALLSHLPKSRQTLLFSATQTNSVNDLARLSLKDPVSIGLEGTSKSYVPQNLEQHFITCTLDKKLDILWSFIKSHLQSKILVFMSACKQVRFVFETFCKMHPGVSLLHLHGKQKQSARLTMYNKFTSTSHAVLFATDIAARGLDFPAVDWVVQIDAPEDAETYIHRVGRTARYESKGKGLLFLMPSEEEGMKIALEKKGITIEQLKIRASKTHSIENQLQSLAFQNPEIKYLGQRAFVAYLRSIYLHKDKSIFKLNELPVERFAESLGLPGAPKIKFLSKEIAKQNKNASRTVAAAQAAALKEAKENVDNSDPSVDESDADEGAFESSDDDESDDETTPKPNPKTPGNTHEQPPSKATGVRTRYDKMFERKNQNILSEHYSKLIDHDRGGDDDDDFITLKRANHDISDDEAVKVENISKRKLKLGRAKRAVIENGVSQKLVFDDDGKAHEIYELADGEDWLKSKGLVGAKEEGRAFAEGERSRMKVANTVDKEEARQKKREKKRKRKEREKEKDETDQTVEAVVVPQSDDDGYISPEFNLSPEDEDEDLAPVTKKSRTSSPRKKGSYAPENNTIEEEEELALKLLRRR